MRRRLDYKFLACLLGALLVAAVGVHFLHGYQVHHNARSLLQQADRADEQGNPERAVEYLRRYLVYVPSDTDARARYGLTLSKNAQSRGEYEQAFLAFERVLREQPQRDDIRREFVRVAMRGGRFAEAQESLDVLMKALPQDEAKLDATRRQQLGHLEQLLGDCLEHRHEYGKAAGWYEKASRHAPQDLDTYTHRVALLRRRLNQSEQADKAVDQMVSANKDSARAYLLRGLYRREFHPPEDGAQDIQKAYALAPEGAEVLRAMADVALGQKVKDFEKARGYLHRSRELHPEDGATYQALARLENEAGRRSEAVACLRQGLKATPKGQQAPLLWDLAQLLIEKEDGAGEAVESLRQAHFPPAQVEYLRARLLVNKGEWFNACKKLEEVRPGLLRWPELAVQADLLLGSCYQQLGDPDQQYAAYRRAEKQDPSSTAAARGVASSLVALGKLDEALEAYRQLVPRLPGEQLEVARLLILQNQSLPPAERRWQEVDQTLEAAAKAAPDLLDVTLLRAEVRMRKGETASARSLLLTARAKQPKEVHLWTALSAVEELDGKPGQALAVLDEAERQLGERVELRLARSRYWARRGGAEGREHLEQLGQGLEKLSVADQVRLLRGLAEGLIRVGDLAGARHLWDRLARQQPKDLGTKLTQFDLALQADDGKGMADSLAGIRDIEGPDGILWSYGRASYLIWQARHDKKTAGLDEARGLLDAVAARRPAWSRVAVCAGEISELKKDRWAAIRSYQRAVNELGNRNPQVIRELVQLLYDQRRYAEAEQVLRKLPDEGSLSPDLLRLTAAVSLEARDYDRAMNLAQKAVSSQSKDYKDHLWLGLMLARVPKRQLEAEGAFRRAATLAGGKPEVWVTLVHFLAERGDKAKARAAIQEAQRRLPKAEAPLALASCYEALGEMDKAKQLYETVRAARPDDATAVRGLASYYLRHGQWKEAQPHLRKVIALGARAPEEAAWARRILAVVLAAGGDYQQSREALNMLGLLGEADQGPAAGGDSADDQRARALVLATQKNRRQQREAIAILENLMARQPLTPDDQLLLAQLYESVGDWPQARKHLLSLVGAQKDKPLYLAAFLHALLRHKEFADVPVWLDRFQQLPEPRGTFDVAEIKARLLGARGRAGDAITVLTGYVADKDSKPAEQGARRLLAANLLDELSRDPAADKAYAPAAEAQYRAYVTDLPGRLVVLAAFLGRHGRLAESLQVCERARETCPAEAVAQISVAVLQASQPDVRQQQYRLVDGWVEAALAKQPEAPRLLFCLACLRDLEGRHEEAADRYRQVLQREDQNALALNNLALVLALHEGKAPEALRLIDRAIEVAGPSPGLRDTRAAINLAMGQTASAIAELDETVADRPLAPGYFHLAQAYLLSGKEQEARQNWQKALAAGLKVRDIHPLERKTYEQLLAKFPAG